ncbi:GNAT family N-acetyltransferase [Cohnella sp. CFH 77786]|uniref:GNAT family N-acetyltransferase n=1 Tax=Cohnella sp. CFH 77786 TaxID=2662265 RepID=UPI001C60EE12|nr:GNAT family N-acetyltransferase [Cohnella sp. CFH 77786]MBW5448162.1 GNAT family N-acetyltransferase [Cohnella sp. CFH 77786]
MEYIRVQSIQDGKFADMHRLLGRIFPPEEVLAYELWEEPLRDPDIHVYVAVHEGRVVGATEYRYQSKLRVSMTDFTIIGEPGLGIGRFLYVNREKDLRRLESESGTKSLGMFAEIYDPLENASLAFGQVLPMHPAVRREVLSHLGFGKLDIAYVHPSWDHEGKAVTGLDLGFRPADGEIRSLPSSLVVSFLRWYYEALPNKPQEWLDMIAGLESREEIGLLPL